MIRWRLITGTNYDWGFYNKISNGGNQAGLWRTLTESEWNYLRYSRPNAEVLFGEAYVNGVYGWVILPDNWTLPTGLNFQSGPIGLDDFIFLQSYTTSDWAKMEANGAVFFPAAGWRNVSDSNDPRSRYVSNAGFRSSNGGFWLGESVFTYRAVADKYCYVSTNHKDYNSECLQVTVSPYGDYGGCALSVRLVRDVE